jgi:hypothetical protein
MIPDLQGELREVFLLTEAVHAALHLPDAGSIVPKTKNIFPEINIYFRALEGTLRDGLPIENLFSEDLKSLAKYIVRFIEVSRHNRFHQIHKRFFFAIHMWLERSEVVNWTHLFQEDLTKALSSTTNEINYGPQLTAILRWAIANPGPHLGTSNRTAPAPRPRPPTTPRTLRNPAGRNVRRRRPRSPSPEPELDRNPAPPSSPNPEPALDLMDFDINLSDILRQIPNIGSEGSHHAGEQEIDPISDRRSGMDQNNPLNPGATNPMNIEVEREEGRERSPVRREGSPDQGSTDSNLGDQLKEIAASLEVLQRKVQRKENK